MSHSCVFTIVAKNYIGIALLLQKSFFAHNSNSDFFIVVADEVDDSLIVPHNIVIAKDILSINVNLWTEMSFKYNLTEFCTAIKPLSFKYFFSMGYNKVVYLDPDIYVFNSLMPIIDDLDKYNVILTPHVSGLHIDYSGEHKETTILWEGPYNLGFCALSKSSKVFIMLDWWAKRLEDLCFAYKGYPLCYDQKWMSLLPCYFSKEEILISRNLGYNIAPWNYFEREIFKENNEYKVRFRDHSLENVVYPVAFVHFAGYKYSELVSGKVQRARLNVAEYDDINALLGCYIQAFKDNSKEIEYFLRLPYSYGTYEDGTTIEKIHRSIYNGLRKEGYIVGNPFSYGKGTLLDALTKAHVMTGSVIEKYNMETYGHIKTKEKYLNLYYRFLKRILGFKTYLLFQKSLYLYVNPERQYILVSKYFKKKNDD